MQLFQDCLGLVESKDQSVVHWEVLGEGLEDRQSSQGGRGEQREGSKRPVFWISH